MVTSADPRTFFFGDSGSMNPCSDIRRQPFEFTSIFIIVKNELLTVAI